MNSQAAPKSLAEVRKSSRDEAGDLVAQAEMFLAKANGQQRNAAEKAVKQAQQAVVAVEAVFAELERTLQAACDDEQPTPTLQSLTAKLADARAALLAAENAVRAVQRDLEHP